MTVVINKHPSLQVHYFIIAVYRFSSGFRLYIILAQIKEAFQHLKLSKLIEVNWRAARLILTKVRAAIGHRDSVNRLSGTIKLDDAFIRGQNIIDKTQQHEPKVTPSNKVDE